VFEDRNIIKIFHDFCEDTGALVRQFEVHCDGVFDAQIAHRLLNLDSDCPRDLNISLNLLLQKYLGGGLENTKKDAIVSEMKTDLVFWWMVRKELH
jgi:ribonuclease D